MEQSKKSSEVLDAYLQDMGGLDDAQYHFVKLAIEDYTKALQAKCERYEKALNKIAAPNLYTPDTWDDIAHNMISIANEALSAGVGDKVPKDKPKACGNCGGPGQNYIGNQYYLCDKCMEEPENL